MDFLKKVVKDGMQRISQSRQQQSQANDARTPSNEILYRFTEACKIIDYYAGLGKSHIYH